MTSHLRFMHSALRLAQRQLGQTWPNPAVGAVLVQNGQIIAEGATAKGGRPHAETEAIKAAGARAKGATLYVTLEPCSHHGKTPPCVDAIINASIKSCVIAVKDSNPLVAGQGIARLKAAGIEVIENVCEQEAREINAGFFSVMEKKRPFISLKIASSLDGKITHPKQRWITSERARDFGHLLRSQYDAILTGVGTVVADNPALTCRLPGLLERSPVRIVMDSKLRIPENAELIESADKVPTWIMTTGNKALGKATMLNAPGDDNGIKLDAAMTLLAEKGITRVLVEAGKKLSTSFIASKLVDRIYWFRAPMTIGSEGLDALNGGMTYPLPEWKKIKSVPLAPDTLEMFEPCSPAS